MPRSSRGRAGGQLIAIPRWTYRVAWNGQFYVVQADPANERAVTSPGAPVNEFSPEEEFTVVARPTVRGHRGVLLSLPGPAGTVRLQCLRWRESAELDVAVCSYGPSGPLGQDELLRIAEGLRRGL